MCSNFTIHQFPILPVAAGYNDYRLVFTGRVDMSCSQLCALLEIQILPVFMQIQLQFKINLVEMSLLSL